jgi:hypothetical protein
MSVSHEIVPEHKLCTNSRSGSTGKHPHRRLIFPTIRSTIACSAQAKLHILLSFECAPHLCLAHTSKWVHLPAHLVSAVHTRAIKSCPLHWTISYKLLPPSQITHSDLLESIAGWTHCIEQAHAKASSFCGGRWPGSLKSSLETVQGSHHHAVAAQACSLILLLDPAMHQVKVL